MGIIINAILPTVLLLVLGNVFRRRGFLPADFWHAADKLTYFVLFPALLVTKVSQVDLHAIDFTPVFAFFALYFVSISGLGYAVYRLSHAAPKQFSSIYQGVLRFSTYIYFAVIEAVWGNAALALAALIAGLVIPLVNVCCVASFAVGSGHFSWWRTWMSIIKNPLILASLLGFVVNLLPFLMPSVIFDTLVVLGTAALPLALLSVGAAVRIKALFATHSSFSPFSLWLTTAARLLVVPAIAWGIAVALGVSADLLHILVVYAAVPTATASFILSKQLGGDADMMASLISLQTIVSILTLSLWLLLLTHYA